jgi:drug/metabolite transporter (DMT)-like permease
MTTPGLRPYLWMLTGSFWFAVMGLLIHALKDDCDWQVQATARSGLATLFAFLGAMLTRTPLVFLNPPVLWVRSLAGSFSMIATFYALTRMPVSEVLTLTNTFPVWVALIGWLTGGERPTNGTWVAVGSAVVGVAVIFRPDLGGLPPAALSALVASVFTAIAMLGLNRLHGVGSLAVVVHFSAVATLVCFASLFAFDRTTGNDRLADPVKLATLLGVGVTAVIGQVFLTRAFRAGPATGIAVVGLSQVVMVMAFEAAAGWKTFDLQSLVGTALVLGPVGWLMIHAHDRTPVKKDEPVVEEVPIE